MIEKKTKLVLGTVQLGMKYGLNNSVGQPTKEDSFLILDKALALGIEIFDTAWAYGVSEDVIGSWIKSRSLAGKIKVISKLKPHVLNDYPDGTKSSDIVRMELEKSLKRLSLDYLDGYLLHSPQYVYLNHVIAGLQKSKKDGIVKNIGVSIYDEAEALQAVELDIDYIQIPYNVFDQRLDATNFFDLAKKNKITVFARSPFLQGLLLMKPDQIPSHLTYLRPYLEKFIGLAAKYNLTPTEAALGFALGSRADHIVFGVDTKEQLIHNADIVKKSLSAVDKGLLVEIKESFKDLNKGAINPSLWNKIKQ